MKTASPSPSSPEKQSRGGATRPAPPPIPASYRRVLRQTPRHAILTTLRVLGTGFLLVSLPILAALLYSDLARVINRSTPSAESNHKPSAVTTVIVIAKTPPKRLVLTRDDLETDSAVDLVRTMPISTQNDTPALRQEPSPAVSPSRQAVTLAQSSRLVLFSQRTYLDGDGNLHIRGEVQNTGATPMGAIQLVATLYAKSDRVLATSATTLDQDLPPSGKAPFEISLERPDGYHHYYLVHS